MIEPNEVKRLGTELAKLHFRYSAADLRKVLDFAYANRLKGGALPRLAQMLKEFALEIQVPRTARRHRHPRAPTSLTNHGNR